MVGTHLWRVGRVLPAPMDPAALSEVLLGTEAAAAFLLHFLDLTPRGQRAAINPHFRDEKTEARRKSWAYVYRCTHGLWVVDFSKGYCYQALEVFWGHKTIYSYFL